MPTNYARNVFPSTLCFFFLLWWTIYTTITAVTKTGLGIARLLRGVGGWGRPIGPARPPRGHDGRRVRAIAAAGRRGARVPRPRPGQAREAAGIRPTGGSDPRARRGLREEAVAEVRGGRRQARVNRRTEGLPMLLCFGGRRGICVVRCSVCRGGMYFPFLSRAGSLVASRGALEKGRVDGELA